MEETNISEQAEKAILVKQKVKGRSELALLDDTIRGNLSVLTVAAMNHMDEAIRLERGLELVKEVLRDKRYSREQCIEVAQRTVQRVLDGEAIPK